MNSNSNLQNYTPITFDIEDDVHRVLSLFKAEEWKVTSYRYLPLKRKDFEHVKTLNGCDFTDSKIYQLITEKVALIKSCEIEHLWFLHRLIAKNSQIKSIQGSGYVSLFASSVTQVLMSGSAKISDSLIGQIEASQIFLRDSIVDEMKSEQMFIKNCYVASIVAKRVLLCESFVSQSVFSEVISANNVETRTFIGFSKAVLHHCHVSEKLSGLKVHAVDCPFIKQIESQGDVNLNNSHILKTTCFSLFANHCYFWGDVSAEVAEVTTSTILGTLSVNNTRLEVVNSTISKIVIGSLNTTIYSKLPKQLDKLEQQLACLLLEKKAHILYQAGQYQWIFGDLSDSKVQINYKDWNDIRIYGKNFVVTKEYLIVDNFSLPKDLNSHVLMNIYIYVSSISKAQIPLAKPIVLLKGCNVEELEFNVPGVVYLIKSKVPRIYNGTFIIA